MREDALGLVGRSGGVVERDRVPFVAGDQPGEVRITCREDTLVVLRSVPSLRPVEFGMALGQTTGFVESLLRLIDVDRAVPDFRTLPRRRRR
jgi:hypothetical protein